MISSYKELTVWQKGFKLALLVYRVTRSFPKDEVYGIVSQLRRAAVSIPSNIAEGHSRRRRLEFLHYLHMAYGSAAELETQVLLSKELEYLSDSDYREIISLLTEVMMMLNSLILKVMNQK